MGNTGIHSPKKNKGQYKGDTQPDDTNLYRNMVLPDRVFTVTISNIKLKNLSSSNAFLVFAIPNTPDIKLQTRKVEQGVVRWNQKPYKVQVKCNEYQLRIQFMNVTLYNSLNKISQIRINLYKVASGPAHLTFPMGANTKNQCRISLDVHFSEWVNVYIQTTRAEVLLNQPCPEQLFNFTIRTITRSNQDQQESEPSYPQKQIIHHHETKDKKSNLNQEHPITWMVKNDKSLPKMERKVGYIELSQSSIQFMLWEIHSVSKQQHDKLVGECYISLAKGYNNDPVQGFRNNRATFIYKANVQQKLWLSGKRIGRVKVDLVIQMQQFIKQNLMLIRTEQGLQLTTPVFDTTKERVQCPEIVELQKLVKQIQQGLSKMQNYKRTQTLKINDARNGVLSYMIKVLSILQSSKKQSTKFFIYKSQKDLLHGQQCLLGIGIRLLQKLEQDQSLILKEYCWKILIALIQRGQLELRYTGFTKQQKSQIQRHTSNKYLKNKFEFSIKYQQFLYASLKSALKSMESKNLEPLERKFVEYYCAFCYLRIPQFRQHLLVAITKKTDKVIQQQRKAQFGIENQKQIQQIYKNDANLSYLYDWQGNFYDLIRFDPRSKQNIIDLQKTLNSTDWKQRMEKRGVACFPVFKLLDIIYSNSCSNISKWYSQLLKALLSEMYRRNLLEYPDALKQVSTKMLSNQKLLNTFVGLIFKKMNLMQYTSVVTGIEIISGYFKHLSSNKIQIPTTFNYLTFLQMLKKIIEHEHSFSTPSCLKLIYDHYNLFNHEFRRQMNLYLLGKVFFRMFLSWSVNIRIVFHHVILFRVVLQSNRLTSDKKALEHNANQQVKRRYLLLMNILENVKHRKDEQQCDSFRLNYQKQYFKKMKKKLNQNRKGSGNINSLKNIKEKTNSDGKYSMSQLSKPAETLRAHSQVLQNVHVNYSKIQEQSFTYQPHTSSQASQSEIRIRKKSTALQHQIPQFPRQLLGYIKQALTQFKQIEQKFNKYYSGGKSDINSAPALAIKIATDEGQFRTPEKDDW